MDRQHVATPLAFLYMSYLLGIVFLPRQPPVGATGRAPLRKSISPARRSKRLNPKLPLDTRNGWMSQLLYKSNLRTVLLLLHKSTTRCTRRKGCVRCTHIIMLSQHSGMSTVTLLPVQIFQTLGPDDTTHDIDAAVLDWSLISDSAAPGWARGAPLPCPSPGPPCLGQAPNCPGLGWGWAGLGLSWLGAQLWTIWAWTALLALLSVDMHSHGIVRCVVPGWQGRITAENFVEAGFQQ